LYLKKLDIFGFKSFAHKLSLEFGPGITCVVGPNGCGKTNVADAIRWVLGEQSPTELRGSSMADVIFNGTKQRRRLGMAEVTLTIDNTGGYLPTDFTEVVIGRRVFRSGESEYSINKAPCRLRDVRDLFLDTGIGTRTYSLIERKMVDSVLSDSTGHRRFMFEEAAGIMKYKVRKRSALNKLEATESDMQRVSDIIAEVEKQVRSLKRQLAQARRHRRYTDGLRELETRLARIDYARWREERSGAERRAQELRAVLGRLTADLQAGDRSGIGIKSELRDKDEALSSLDLEIGEIEGRARDLAEALLVARERRSASERRAGELEAEISDIRADLSKAVERARDLETEIGAATEACSAKEQELTAKAEALRGVEVEHRRLKDVLDGQKQTRIEGLESSAGIKGELESYRARLDDLAGEHVEIERALAEARAGLAEKEAAILAALEEERRAMGESHAARSREKEAAAGLDRAREGLLEARERKTLLSGELDAGRHKAELLAEIRDGYGGYQDGVRALFSDGAGGLPGLVGTVADVIDVDPGMDTAVEAALGGATQYVVVRDVGCAKAAMGHLMAGSLGRATFLPLDGLRALPISEVPERILESEGVVGPATRFVRIRGDRPGLGAFLLEGVVIVRDLDTALRLAADPEASELAFVTPSGDMATASGVLAGGRPGNEEAGLLRRTERLDAARREVDALTRRLVEAAESERRAAELLESAAAAAAQAERASEQAEAALWEAKRGVTELELAKTNLAEKASQLAANRDALAARMDSTRGDVEVLARRLDQLSRGEDALGARLDELEREHRIAERASAKAAEDEKQAEIEAAAARSAVTRLKAERAQLTETVAAAKASIGRKTEEREQHIRTMATLDEAIARDSRAADELAVERRTLEADRDGMREAAQGLRGRIETIEDEARSARERKEEVQRDLHEVELGSTELRGRIEALRERIREEYSIDVEEEGPPAPPEGEEPFDQGAAREEVERLKARLRSMGPVNLLALDEYDEESKRLEFLQAQYEDLERSKESLKLAIERINETATRMFVETFGKVRTNFIETFQRLFEGGEADLRLDEPGAPLESPIEIVASPRGKRLGRLSLLSGGERALTAIALLFAIYLVKPSPFCILDEVDAPLDDANVDRFVRMLREFSERTQFVIITHNKTTMQAADRLYGITMEESGVSKVVSVRLDTARGEVRSEEAVLEAT
jgi:chromosome segregation protein